MLSTKVGFGGSCAKIKVAPVSGGWGTDAMMMLRTVMAGPFTLIQTLQYYHCKFTFNSHSRVHYPEARASRTLKVSMLLSIEVIIHLYFSSGLFLFSPLDAVWM